MSKRAFSRRNMLLVSGEKASGSSRKSVVGKRWRHDKPPDFLSLLSSTLKNKVIKDACHHVLHCELRKHADLPKMDSGQH